MAINGVDQLFELPAVLGQKKDDEKYKMDHAKRGLALIFVHTKFEILGDSGKVLSPRSKTEMDVKAMQEGWGRLGFRTDVCQDYKRKQIVDRLTSVAEDDHTDSDCLVIVVMTHGESNKLCAYDRLYKIETLWMTFTGESCSTLRGKPKLFFIQACRGDEAADSVAVRTESDGSTMTTYTIPSIADIFIAYSSCDGHVSGRDDRFGSWFIFALGKALEEFGEREEICELLTRVNRIVATSHTINMPNDNLLHNKKQMPNFLSTLTRKLYFNSN